MNWNKLCAGIFAGAGALFLIYKGEIAVGASILSGMLAFFIGDTNGKREANATLLRAIAEKVSETPK